MAPSPTGRRIPWPMFVEIGTSSLSYQMMKHMVIIGSQDGIDLAFYRLKLQGFFRVIPLQFFFSAAVAHRRSYTML
jgi:hypothetical protein